MSGAAVLDGVRVVEIAHERSLWAGKLLADMGADVILVEPPSGSPTRGYPPFVADEPDAERSLYWWHYNTSKRGITLDLDDEAGREVFARLITSADVLLEGEAPGRLASLSLDYSDLLAHRASLIMASITPFGRETSRKDEHATDLTILAGGGPVWSCGYDDHSLPPIRGGGNQGHQTACHYAVMSILTAYYHLLRTGEGQHIDVSQHAAANVTTEMASYHWLVQQGTVARQTGRHAMEHATLGAQTLCKDGRYVTTGVPPRQAREFAAVHAWLGRLGLLEGFPEAVFLEMGAQKESFDLSLIGVDDETTAIFSAGREAMNLIASKISAYEYFIGGQEIGMAVGAIYSPEEAMDDPHWKARGFPTEVEHAELGRTVIYPGAPYRFEKTPWRIARRAPRLGEHNDEIFASIGIEATRREALRRAGVI